jgi:hypothetical protein
VASSAMRLTNSKNCVDAMNLKTTFRVNDTAHELSLDPRITLLDALRELLAATDTIVQ